MSDEPADAARKGVQLIDRAEALSELDLKEVVKRRAAEAAQRAALGSIRAVAEWTGSASTTRPRVGPTPEAVDRMLAALDAANVAEFDGRLAQAASRTVAAEKRAAQAAIDVDALEADRLAALRRSFPPEAKELAVLVFACVDLLEDLAEIDTPPSVEVLARKEQLIAKIGALLAGSAQPALEAFVAHVVALSAQRRGGR